MLQITYAWDANGRLCVPNTRNRVQIFQVTIGGVWGSWNLAHIYTYNRASKINHTRRGSVSPHGFPTVLADRDAEPLRRAATLKPDAHVPLPSCGVREASKGGPTSAW